MLPDRLSAVLAAMEAVAGDGSVAITDRVCAAAVDMLDLSGAAITLLSADASDGVAASAYGFAGRAGARIVDLVQELQETLGEGPAVDAWRDGAPVMAGDLRDGGRARWPAFASEAAAVGARAVFAFPLRLGAIRIGVLLLCRDVPGVLAADEFAHAAVVADVATQIVLGLQAGAGDALHELLGGAPAHWAEVHQATGIVSVQLGVSLAEAFVRLRARAFGDGRPLRALAVEVVAGTARLDGAG